MKTYRTIAGVTPFIFLIKHRYRLLLAMSLMMVVVMSVVFISLWNNRVPLDSTHSPAGTYKVDIFDDNPFVALVFNRAFTFGTWKNGTSRTGRMPLVIIEGGNSEFVKRYSTSQWVSENILEFRKTGSEAISTTDQIVLTNRGSRPVRELVLESRSLFIVLDLLPGQSQSFSTPRQKWTSWTRVSAYYEDNTNPLYSSDNFFHRDSIETSIAFLIDISDDEVSISHREVNQGEER